MFSPTNIPFNSAEVAIHKRLGIAEQLHHQVSGFIRAEMPDQHRYFYESLPMAIIGLTDMNGDVWATPVFGQPGFVRTPNSKQLLIETKLLLAGSVDLDIRAGAKIGMLGIELSTRRRNRVNGVISHSEQLDSDTRALTFDVDQSYGNCPQYIQKREFNLNSDALEKQTVKSFEVQTSLSSQAIVRICEADTFFIASRSRQFTEDPRSGIDASHRGGKPGFIKVENNRLLFPDFSGNRFFNTIGNIEDDGRVGLYIPDLDTGSGLFISGTAKVIWEHELLSEYHGAQRFIEIECEQVIEANNIIPFNGHLVERSPSLLSTGDWPVKHGNAVSTKRGFRPFKLVKKIPETATVSSFYFEPIEGNALPPLVAGQYLPVRLINPDTGQPIERNYTVSQLSTENGYRISVKRETHGQMSGLLHNHLALGDIVELGKPIGNFGLASTPHSCVMLSAGIGITPMLSMLEQRILESQNKVSPAPVHFFYACKNTYECAFADFLNTLAKRHKWLRVYIAFSKGLGHQTDQKGLIKQLRYCTILPSRLDISALRAYLPFDNYHFYLCGAKQFMQTLYQQLTAQGVAKSHLHYEFFGQGSLVAEELNTVKNDTNNGRKMTVPKQANIRFAMSAKKALWKQGNLLEFAEQLGVTANASCRKGECGSCEVTLLDGDVQYAEPTRYSPQSGKVLLCCAYPKNDSEIVLDV